MIRLASSTPTSISGVVKAGLWFIDDLVSDTVQ